MMRSYFANALSCTDADITARTLTQDSLRITTGCQDGHVRIYDTCNPTAAPAEYKVSGSITEGISKVCWSREDKDIIFVGKKSGVVEKWDTRVGNMSAPIASVTADGGDVVMDFELSPAHDTMLVASGKKVGRLRNGCNALYTMVLYYSQGR